MRPMPTSVASLLPPAIPPADGSSDLSTDAGKQTRVDIMRIVTLSTDEEMQAGITGMSPIPPDVLFIFPRVTPGMVFHSQGVLADFEIAFLDPSAKVVLFAQIHPEEARIMAPPGTSMAVESAVGTISGLGFGRLSELLKLS